MSILSKKAAPAQAVPPAQRKVAVPPVYRPQAPLLQARMAAPSAVPARPLAPPVFRPQPFAPPPAALRARPVPPPVFHAQATAALQARRAPGAALARPPARVLIQRASSMKQTESEVAAAAALAERNYLALLGELDIDEKKAKPSSAATAAKPKKKSVRATKMAASVKAAAASTAQSDEARRLAAEQAAAADLVAAVAEWHEFEQGAVAVLFGLMERGYLTLAEPHRCFLSVHEKTARGARRAKSFGLSKKILLAEKLKEKYRETHGAKPVVRVLHLHCNGDGTVRSFGVKQFLAEGLVGYNYVVPAMYTARANAFVGDIDGDNVEVKVKVFD